MKIIVQRGKEAKPGRNYAWLVASRASEITDAAGVKGKKIRFNANGHLCELAWRDHLAAMCLTIDDVGPVVLGPCPTRAVREVITMPRDHLAPREDPAFLHARHEVLSLMRGMRQKLS